jgi:glycyl-tRNA synthetase beta chain
MRWGSASASTESLRWVRPLQGIVAILGGKLVPCEIDGIAAGVETVGHRFLSEGAIKIGSADDYAEKLRAAFVILDHKEREGIIREQADALAAEAGLSRKQDPALVAENAGLTEWPVPLLGSFDEAFLAVAPEAITLAMRSHQKYFACERKDGSLSPHFICVANLQAEDDGAYIVSGNEKVLAARLSDANFFWNQDLKISLAEQATKLDQIVFHEKLGTVAQRHERFAGLTQVLADHFEFDQDAATHAATLCKSDLVTGMVGEFADLQGIMGGYYAREEGLGTAVSEAIRDHYKPVGQSDFVPFAPVSIALALADKLDAIVGFFGIDLQPTGSKDPFALRRAALGIIRLITDNKLRIPLTKIFPAAAQLYANQGIAVEDRTVELVGFFADRLKVQQREAGVRHDLIDAILALGEEDDLVRLLARVKALQSFISSYDGANLLAGYKRAANILKIEEKKEQKRFSPTAAIDYDSAADEAVLLASLDAAEPKVDAAIATEDFEAAMAALAELRAPIDGFFDTVTVNDEDRQKRESRLGLLVRMRDAVHGVADFSKIEGAA